MEQLTVEQLDTLRAKLGRGYPKLINAYFKKTRQKTVKEAHIRKCLLFEWQSERMVLAALAVLAEREKNFADSGIAEQLEKIQDYAGS